MNTKRFPQLVKRAALAITTILMITVTFLFFMTNKASKITNLAADAGTKEIVCTETPKHKIHVKFYADEHGELAGIITNRTITGRDLYFLRDILEAKNWVCKKGSSEHGNTWTFTPKTKYDSLDSNLRGALGHLKTNEASIVIYQPETERIIIMGLGQLNGIEGKFLSGVNWKRFMEITKPDGWLFGYERNYHDISYAPETWTGTNTNYLQFFKPADRAAALKHVEATTDQPFPYDDN